MTVKDTNEAPTDIDIVGSWEVDENLPPGSMIGTLVTFDEDVGQKYSYFLLAVAKG